MSARRLLGSRLPQTTQILYNRVIRNSSVDVKPSNVELEPSNAPLNVKRVTTSSVFLPSKKIMPHGLSKPQNTVGCSYDVSVSYHFFHLLFRDSKQSCDFLF